MLILAMSDFLILFNKILSLKACPFKKHLILTVTAINDAYIMFGQIKTAHTFTSSSNFMIFLIRARGNSCVLKSP
jgi:hypothetical protein